ncbi:MAG: glycosyltransferase family 2 protein [Paracoccus sp. (in: a-proteobacteria)]
MTVTVCIPAYRAEGFIAETVASVLAQGHDDLKLVVSVDPPDDGGPDGTLAVLDRFAADPRLAVHVNPTRLGWAENMNALLAHVATPFFCFLPHDDIWSPRYLETMLAALEARPGAINAYGDILRFGAVQSVRKSVTLPADADRPTALLHFLLQGTEALMWRGVTRSRVLERLPGFPTDRHKGFVVECEYALNLLAVGAVCHVPQTHYFKRIYGHDVISASRERMLHTTEERLAGWREHDRRMRNLLAAALTDMGAGPDWQALCHAAKEAALLRRCQQFVEPRLDQPELIRAERVLAWCDAVATDTAGQVAARMHLVMARHWQAEAQPDHAAASRQAARLAAATYESVLAHAQALHQEQRHLEALERAVEAKRIGHLDDTRVASQLITRIYRTLGWMADG